LNQRSKADKKVKTNIVHNTYSDNIIFSEDDRASKKIIDIKDSLVHSESEAEELEVIKKYVLELTNAMINEVCLRSESQSPSTENKSSHKESDEPKE